MIAESLPTLLMDWHHWAFELVSGFVFFLVGTLPARAWLRRHDRKRHGHG